MFEFNPSEPSGLKRAIEREKALNWAQHNWLKRASENHLDHTLEEQIVFFIEMSLGYHRNSKSFVNCSETEFIGWVVEGIRASGTHEERQISDALKR